MLLLFPTSDPKDPSHHISATAATHRAASILPCHAQHWLCSCALPQQVPSSPSRYSPTDQFPGCDCRGICGSKKAESARRSTKQRELCQHACAVSAFNPIIVIPFHDDKMRSTLHFFDQDLSWLTSYFSGVQREVREGKRESA